METKGEFQPYVLQRAGSKPEIFMDTEDNYKLFKVKKPKEEYLKNKMENVYEKLGNDLKWYKESLSNLDFEQAELTEKKETIIRETVDKKFSEKTASRLVEEWWLGS